MNEKETTKQNTTELSGEELSAVSGGAISMEKAEVVDILENITLRPDGTLDTTPKNEKW